MAELHFKEIFDLEGEGGEYFPQGEEIKKKIIVKQLSLPCELASDVMEIVDGFYEYADSESLFSAAFEYADEILYVRIFDGEKYLFPLPFMLSECADVKSACINLSLYARREMIPLIITDIPRCELEVLSELFLHVDAWCYEDDDDSFYAKINNECDMLDELPTVTHGDVTLGEISDSEKFEYAQLCRNRELNRYWGYDADEDNPDGDYDYYLDVARREFDSGVAITLAVRYENRFAGEAVIYDFDYRGSAAIAVRILPEYHGKGLGSLATEALISVAKDIGLRCLRAEIMNENTASVKMASKYMELEKIEKSKTKFTLSL